MLALVVDSSSALTREEARRLGATLVPMTYAVDGVPREEGFLGENAGCDELLAEGRITGTAGVPTERFVPIFRELTARGDDVLCITLSAKLSSTCLHAREAADLVRSELRRQAGATSREANSAARARTKGLPRIAVLDSQSGIGGVENLARHARRMADEGVGFDEMLARLEELRGRQGLCFTVPSTDALRASGRMAMVPLSVNTLLNRYPVLTMKGGAINHVGTARGTAALARDMVACIPADAVPDFVITHFGTRGSTTVELLHAVKQTSPQAKVRVKEGGPVLSYILGSGAVSITWDAEETAPTANTDDPWSVIAYDELPPEAVAIRTAVFMEEQGFQDEFDAIDDDAAHLANTDDPWSVIAYDELPPEAVAIRTAVFMEEQGFQDEFDAIDDDAAHLVGFMGDKPAACARVYWNEERGCYVVGRIAVDRELRGHSLGARILQAAEDLIAARGGSRSELCAQERASGFYEKQGYVSCGEGYLDEGCPHIWMTKELG